MFRDSLVASETHGNQSDGQLQCYDDTRGRVVAVHGEFDILNAKELDKAIAREMETTGAIVVDLSDACFIDAHVLTVLVRRRRDFGRRLQIVVPAWTVIYHIFEMTGLIRGLDVRESLADAERALRV